MRLQLTLTGEQAGAVKRQAAREGVSAAEIVRGSVETYATTCRPDSRGYVRHRALKAAGALRGGLPDLSRRHDDYLAEPSASLTDT